MARRLARSFGLASGSRPDRHAGARHVAGHREDLSEELTVIGDLVGEEHPAEADPLSAMPARSRSRSGAPGSVSRSMSPVMRSRNNSPRPLVVDRLFTAAWLCCSIRNTLPFSATMVT